jgi:carboxyl-terminal processing protease
MKKYPSLLFMLFLFITSCDKVLLEDEKPANPVSTFDYLWNDFDRMYGLFLVKNINWDSLYQVYRPLVNKNSTDKELYEVITSMLDNLNDGHVAIFPTDHELRPYHSGKCDAYILRKDFKLQLVKDHYLSECKTYSNIIEYGKLPDNIGYIYIKEMGNLPGYYKKAFKKILEYMKDTKSIIIDVRNNGGGWDKTVEEIGGRFFTRKTLFLIIKRRNGPNHDDFSGPINYYIEPYGDFQYVKPLVLLTNRVTASAAESFILGMRRRENVIQIGDTTEGSFSDAPTRQLINGWFYTLSIGDYRDYNNVNWEGIGCIPNIAIQNDSTDIIQGNDKVLERAISYIENGN